MKKREERKRGHATLRLFHIAMCMWAVLIGWVTWVGGFEPTEKPSTGKGQKRPMGVLPKSGETWREPATGMAFVWVPEGCFKMGSPAGEEGRDPDEGPIHEVCLDGFWMGRTEVTNAQFRNFKPDYHSEHYKGHSLDGDDQPVTWVNWEDAKALAKWLTDRRAGKYHFRLPTEAEWEYACRANTTTSRFWGDDPERTCEYANVADLTAERLWAYWETHNCDDGFAVTAPVGTFKPNAFGLHDMLGNAFEWCEDVYNAEAYRHHRSKNPVFTGSGSEKVIRGGAWYSWQSGVRCAGRSDHPPEGRYRDYFMGIRLVRDP